MLLDYGVGPDVSVKKPWVTADDAIAAFLANIVENPFKSVFFDIAGEWIDAFAYQEILRQHMVLRRIPGHDMLVSAGERFNAYVENKILRMDFWTSYLLYLNTPDVP
jgi:hypothetical protein